MDVYGVTGAGPVQSRLQAATARALTRFVGREAELEQLHHVLARAGSGHFPEREYTFKHALTHEEAYCSLLQERRWALHARIVEALEALAGERVAEQIEWLAYHTLRGEVWDKAMTYCRQAGEKAMTRSAHRGAVGYFEQALSRQTVVSLDGVRRHEHGWQLILPP
jgi:hypothetical protein